MKRGEIIGGFRAEEYEGIEAAKSAPYNSKTLYHVVGMPGIWRRVSKPKVSDLVANGILPCHFDGSTIYLKRDHAANLELTQGGYVEPVTDEFNAMVLNKLREAEIVADQPTLPHIGENDLVEPGELPPPDASPDDTPSAVADEPPEM